MHTYSYNDNQLKERSKFKKHLYTIFTIFALVGICVLTWFFTIIAVILIIAILSLCLLGELYKTLLDMF